jgi:membrane protein DedA with SNARE-associated domain
MHEIVNPAYLTDWITTWGYLGVFICVFVGNLGIPIPEETVMLVAGFLAGREVLDLNSLYAVAIASAVTGDCCGFLIGRTGGQRILGWLTSSFASMRHRCERLQMFFQSHGSKAVFMARFITGARFMAGPMAGAAGMPFLRFFGWNVLGALVWCTLVITVGYLVGDELYEVATVAHSAGRWIGLGVLLLALAVFFFWWRERHQAVSTRSKS